MVNENQEKNKKGTNLSGIMRMGTPREPQKVKLFIALLFEPRFDISALLVRLHERFGEEEFRYGPVDFSWSDYYATEMGDHLKKLYVSYATAIDRETLPSVKLFTNSIESEHMALGKRIVNIDPGYIARDKFVLASTKDFYHRLYLADGVYGEVTLHFRKGAFRYFSWTYPDYKEQGVQELLVRARAGLVGDIRKSEG
jgi:hypothetical protein